MRTVLVRRNHSGILKQRVRQAAYGLPGQDAGSDRGDLKGKDCCHERLGEVVHVEYNAKLPGACHLRHECDLYLFGRTVIPDNLYACSLSCVMTVYFNSNGVLILSGSELVLCFVE